MMNTALHFGISIEEMDPVSRKVYDGLMAGISKKELANKYRMDMSTINAISKRFHTGQKVVKITPAIREYGNIQVEEKLEDITPVVETKEFEPQSVKEIKQRKKYTTLTEEDVKMIIDLMKDGQSNPDIADLFGVSSSTISRIRVKNNLALRVRKKAEEPKPAKETKIIDHSQIVNNIKPEFNIIRVGLIEKRHSMPALNFIFKEINPDNMFEYDKLDNIVRNFILNNIRFENGTAVDTIMLYCTGMTCALASVIKVTGLMNVNLVLRHYDKDSKTYKIQPIWTNFGSVRLGEFVDILSGSTNACTYKCNIEDLRNSENIIRVSRVMYNDASTNNISRLETYLCKDTIEAVELLNYLVEDSENKNLSTAIYGESCRKCNGIFEDSNEFRMKKYISR